MRTRLTQPGCRMNATSKTTTSSGGTTTNAPGLSWSENINAATEVLSDAVQLTFSGLEKVNSSAHVHAAGFGVASRWGIRRRLYGISQRHMHKNRSAWHMQITATPAQRAHGAPGTSHRHMHKKRSAWPLQFRVMELATASY